jgi:hypothetical protein
VSSGGRRGRPFGFGAAALLLALSGCSREPPPKERPPQGPVEPLDALSRRLGRARARLRERGYEERRWASRFFLPAGTGHAEVVRLRRGLCTTYVALSGGSVRELALALYDRDGRRAAVDSVRGEGSLVHACPPSDEAAPASRSEAIYYLTAKVTGGGGAVAVRAFESPLGASAGVEGIFDGILVRPDEGEDVATRLERTVQRLRARDLRPIGRPTIGRVLEGEALRRAETLEPGHCYVAVARGDEGVRDVVLYLVDPSDAEVGRDLEGRDEARIEHCVDEPGRYVIEARAAEGSGDLGIALVEDPNAAPTEPPRMVETPPPPPHEGDASGLVRATMRELTTRGYEAPRYLVRHAAMRPGESLVHEVMLGAGCWLVVAAPEVADMDLDLYLVEQEGEIAARDTRITAEARLAACPPQDEVYRVMVRGYGHEGTYSLVVLRAPEGATDVQRLRLLEAAAPFIARGYRSEAVVEHLMSLGEAFRTEATVPAGSCIMFTAAGGQALEDVDLFLRDETGHVVASDTGPNAWASVSRCADVTTRFELRVLAYRGAGRVLVESFRKP